MITFPLTSILVYLSHSNLPVMIIKQVWPGYSFCGSAYRKVICIKSTASDMIGSTGKQKTSRWKLT